MNTMHTLFVFDFDWTVVNCNSDEYVPSAFLGTEATQNGFRELVYADEDGTALKDDFDWHKCVEVMVNRALDKDDVTVQDVLDAAGRMPYLSEVKEGIIDISGQDGAVSMILSDGNSAFISAFLEANDMTNVFAEGIMTNDGSFVDGKLQVIHQSKQYGGHSCGRCAQSPNLCKTQALQSKLCQIREAREEKNCNDRIPSRIVYVGDGANDVCPVLNVLREGDVFLARAGSKLKATNNMEGPQPDRPIDSVNGGGRFGALPALDKAAKNGQIPSCKIMEWERGDELRNLIRNRLEGINLQ